MPPQKGNLHRTGKIYLNSARTALSHVWKHVEEVIPNVKALDYTDIYWIWWEGGVGMKWYG